MAILGIDLGTTNSLASVWIDGKSVLIPNSFGSYFTPSVVSIDGEGKVIIGQVAKERLITHPAYSMSSFKKYMGTNKEFFLGEQRYTAEVLSALVLSQLKKDAETFLGEPVSEAIISVPAYFNDSQRNSTKLAGKLAGLSVSRLINEPSAAALYYNTLELKEESSFLVFDFGGGTLDVTLVDCFENIINVVSVSGNHLGGDDFDQLIAKHFCKTNSIDYETLPDNLKQVLKKQAESCKIALSSEEAVVLMLSINEKETYTLSLSNELIIQISAKLLLRMEEPIRKVLMDSQYDLSLIDEIVLVGGSCRMPLVREFLSRILKRQVLIKTPPETLVSLGLGVYCGIKERKSDIKDLILTDVCPYTLGVKVYNKNDIDKDLMCPVIERNSALPCSKVQRFYAVNQNQNSIQIEIFQGENIYTSQNLKLGEVEYSIFLTQHKEPYVDVRFSYNLNGILEVEVWSETNKKKSLVIMNRKNEILNEELQQTLTDFSVLKTMPADESENILILAKIESLYVQTTGTLRKDIVSALEWFNSILSTQERYKIEKARKKMYHYLDSIEKHFQSFDPFDARFFKEEEE